MSAYVCSHQLKLRGIRPPAQHMEASSPVTSGGTSGEPRARGAPAQTCTTLEKFPGKQPWTNIQTQKGSCRSMDTVEASDWMPPEAKDSCEIEYVSLSKTHFAHGCKLALDWMLPDAKDSSERIVVLLDWYSGHHTEEVRELVHSKGHVLLLHGAGCTPYAQVMDTPFHATLAGGQAGSKRIPLNKLGVWPQNRGTSSCSGLRVHEAAAGDTTAVPERP